MNDALYSIEELPEIYSINEAENELEVSEDSLQAEWCPDAVGQVSSVQVAVTLPSDPEVEQSENKKNFKKRRKKRKKVGPPVPEYMSAVEALKWKDHPDVDIRPHLFDKDLGCHLLIDSGSQVTACPPDPGDKPLKDIYLKAVNGTKIKCFGYKELVVKINRKQYRYKAYKAQVDSPVLGWDFVRHHRL